MTDEATARAVEAMTTALTRTIRDEVGLVRNYLRDVPLAFLSGYVLGAAMVIGIVATSKPG
jgi:hypothetical protein